jgi:hypothetical protein
LWRSCRGDFSHESTEMQWQMLSQSSGQQPRGALTPTDSPKVLCTSRPVGLPGNHPGNAV